mmetsp:Transcript_80256/g.181097  ORF Transcript_80256/g.181097 Transcript_80256/m.181097 type:complete len:233 (-) Transcript_80256:147-845(-)
MHQESLLDALGQGRQLDLLLLWLAYLLLRLFADELGAADGTQVGEEEHHGRVSLARFVGDALADLKGGDRVGVHANCHEGVQEEQDDDYDIREYERRAEEVSVVQDGAEVDTAGRRHHDGDEGTPEGREEVGLIAVAHEQGHGKAEEHDEDQAGETKEVDYAPLQHAHEGLERTNEGEVLQDLEPAHEPEPGQDRVAKLQSRDQHPKRVEDLRIGHDLGLQVWLRACPREDD